MTWTIEGTDEHTPQQILDYTSSRESLNSAEVGLDSSLSSQLRDAGPPVGRFRALFPTLSSAQACRDDIGTGHLLTVTDDEDADLDMTFHLADGGRAEIEVNNEVDVWVLVVDFQEVP